MNLTGKNLIEVVKKHPLGVGCVFLSIVLLAIIYFRSGKSAEVEARLESVSATGQRLKTNISYSVQLNRQLESLTEAMDIVQERAIRPGELAQNLQYFYKLESDSGVTLVDLRPLNPIIPARPKKAPASAFVSMPFNVGVQGEFGNVMAFLRNLENGGRFSRITSATLKPSGGTSVGLTLSVELLGQL